MKLLEKARQKSQEFYNLIFILLACGCHIDVYCDPRGHSVAFDGVVLSWKRPKTWAQVQHNINLTWSTDRGHDPKEYARQIQWWLANEYERKDRMTYHRWIKALGKSLKLSGLSAMSFRHTFCYRRLRETRGDLARVMGEMRASHKVVLDNYLLIDPRDLI